jgi:hypothetical protein
VTGPDPKEVRARLQAFAALGGPLTGGEVLDQVHAFLCEHVAFPSGHAAVATTLWAAHTHLVERFESTPRLALLSPEKQCGKSRVLELLDLLCAGAEMLSDSSAPYLFRRIGDGRVTILLDEADAIWKRGKGDESAEALRSIINAGHRKFATVGRVVMNGSQGETVRFPVYAPVAVAGIGSLPDTILDRSVIVHMRRRAPGEQVRAYRERITRPEGEALRELLVKWALDVGERVGDPWPDMPDGVDDRPADVWEPLVAVADLAGGHWPRRARDACTDMIGGAWADTESTGTRLLTDLLYVFGEASALWTSTILLRLHGLDESPWAEWWFGKPINDRALAKLLKPYDVASVQLREGHLNHRGYRRADLESAWASYLPGGSATDATSASLQVSSVSGENAVADVSATPESVVADISATGISANAGLTCEVALAAPVAQPLGELGEPCDECGWPVGSEACPHIDQNGELGQSAPGVEQFDNRQKRI